MHVISYDEKPGIQAIATTSEDIRPDVNHPTVSRDYEYKDLVLFHCLQQSIFRPERQYLL